MEEGIASARAPAEVILQRKISSGNEVFSSIQSKLRSCPSGITKVIKFFDGLITSSTNKDKEKREKINLKTFLGMLTSELAVTFDETEASYCNKRFCFLDTLDVNKLYAALDIGRPDTHTDPDYFADKLPQPYRLVSKIIEMEILDRAWLEITRIHPEYLLGSDGKPIFVPKSQRMQYVNRPVGEKAIEFVSLREAPVGNFVFGTSASGEFAALDSSTDQVSNSIQAIGGDIPGSPPMLSPLKIVSITEPTKKKRIIRVLLVCKSEKEELKKVEEPVIDPKAKGKKPPVVEEPKMETKSIVLLTVVEISLAPPKRKGFSTPAMQVVARVNVELPEGDSIDTVGADIALDGSLVCACVSAGFTLFELTDMKKSKVESTATVAVGPIDEEAKEGVSPRPAAPTSSAVEFLTPILFFNDYVEEDKKDPCPAATLACRSCHFVEIVEEDDNIPKCTNALFNMEGLREEDIYPPQIQMCRFSLVLLFDVCNYWLSFTFLKTPELDEEGEGDDALVACTSWEDAKYAYSISERQKISHACPITSSCFSEGNIVLAMGYQDGTLTLHQAVDKVAISCPFKHNCPITSTCIAYNPYSKLYTLISGALDGSLLFTQIEIAVPITYETWGYAPRPEPPPLQVFLDAAARGEGIASIDLPCIDFRCHRIDDREDVSGAYVSSIHHIRESPVAVVHYSNGIIAAYDIETGKVLGKLVLYYGSKAKEFIFRPLVTVDAIDIFNKKTPLPVERPAPPALGRKYSKNENDESENEKQTMNFENIRHIVDFKLLAATPQGKFQCLYIRNGTPILVSHSLESIMRELYPGIAALAQARPEPYPLKDFLNHLTGPQRLDAELTIDAVPSLLAVYAPAGYAEGSIAGGSSSSNPGSRGPGSAQNSNPSSRKNSVSQADAPGNSRTASAAGSRAHTSHHHDDSSRPKTTGDSQPWITKPPKVRPDPAVLSTTVDPDMEHIFRTPVRSIVWEDKLDMRRLNWTLEQELIQNAPARAKSFMPFMKEMQRQAEEMEGKEELAKAAAAAAAELGKK